MKHSIHYDMNTLEGRNRAVRDCEDWLGEGRAELVRRAILSGEIGTMDNLRFVLSFAGVEGAPVTAFGERHGLYD